MFKKIMRKRIFPGHTMVFFGSLIVLLSILFYALAVSSDKGVSVDIEGLTMPLNSTRGETPRFADNASDTEIVEIFMYTCPHCSTMHEPLTVWSADLPSDVYFEAVPVVFNRGAENFLRLHYALVDHAGVNDKLVMSSIFEHVHLKRLPLNTLQEFTELGMSISGKSRESIAQWMVEPSVDDRVSRSWTLLAKSGTQGVPAFIVNNTMRLDPSDAGSMSEIMTNLDLISLHDFGS